MFRWFPDPFPTAPAPIVYSLPPRKLSLSAKQALYVKHKDMEERVLRHIDELLADDALDETRDWLEQARHTIQTGFMQLTYAVVAPKRAGLPEDAA